MSGQLSFPVANTVLMEPEEFQKKIIEAMTGHLLLYPSPALLVAPTGAGKTFMLGKTIARLSTEKPTVWFWFTPFSTLVGQAILALDWIDGLNLYSLATERQRDHSNGDVLVANIQQVSSKNGNRQVLKQADDFNVTIHGIVARARASGLCIGVVVDEAHIGVSSETEFGKFVKGLMPDSLIMTTATPNDVKLNAFLAASGFCENKVFSVSRSDAVDALLNKEFIAAYVYRVTDDWKNLVDLQHTMLQQAWHKHCAIKNMLKEANIQTIPLLLVQVEDGDNSTKEAYEFLTKECGVHPSLIGEHTSQTPDPQLMNSIAHDTSKEVLIFKEAAGVGFDAPRAFVLASMKKVTDKNYALQFIGRVMRVDRKVREEIRNRRKKGDSFPDDLNTAYVYLANAEAQEGYQKAVTVSQGIKSQLEGATERLKLIKTRHGEPQVFTNRPALMSFIPQMEVNALNHSDSTELASSPSNINNADKLAHSNAFDDGLFDTRLHPDVQSQSLLFDDYVQPDWDEQESSYRPSRLQTSKAQNIVDLHSAFDEIRLSLYPRRDGLPCFEKHLRTELRPAVVNLAKATRRIAMMLVIEDKDLMNSLASATGRTQAFEQRTELVSHAQTKETLVTASLRRDELAKQAKSVLQSTIKLEDADIRDFVKMLADRVKIGSESSGLSPMIEESDPSPIYRDMVHNLILIKKNEIAALYHDAIAQEVTDTLTKCPLPDFMTFPSDLPLLPSAKNAYGVMPPSRNDDMPKVEQLVLHEERKFLKFRSYPLDTNEIVWIDGYNGTHAINADEKEFAKQLDNADFVLWWHRNPDRSDYGVAVVRPDSNYNFWPDFVVCVQYITNTEPVIRLTDTKHDLKDALKKSRREHKTYKRIIFLTKDDGNLFLVDQEGRKGQKVGSGLNELREEFRRSDSY